MCNPERIAERGCFSLHACGEDRVTLSMGPVSVRLERDTLRPLMEFLATVERRLIVREEHGEYWREIVHAPDLEQDR